MTEHIDHKVDRTGWSPGPWDLEPDRIEWRAHGFPCLIVRSETMGALCGYVGLPPGHPLHGEPYDIPGVDVHGGLTYSGSCAGHICHIARPGEPDAVWWLGFDCGHPGDKCPATDSYIMRGLGRSGSGDYRDVEYVKAEVEKLAKQFKDSRHERS
jgi:hypothetical protein